MQTNYVPSVEDFKGASGGYMPTVEDFNPIKNTNLLSSNSNEAQQNSLKDVIQKFGNPTAPLPFKQQLSSSAVNFGRGALDVVEGLKQATLNALEEKGLVTPGTSQNYTNEVEKERAFYANKMNEAKAPYAAGARAAGNILPYALPVTDVAKGIQYGSRFLPNLIKGTTTGGAIGGTQFVDPGQSRLGNIEQGASIGALIPSAASFFKGAGGLIKSGTNLLTAPFRSTAPYEDALQQAENKAQALSEESVAPVEKQNLANVQDQIDRMLNIGSVHKVSAAPQLASRANAIDNYWKDAYSNFIDKIRGRNVTMPENTMGNGGIDMDAIRSAAQQGRLGDILKGKVGLQDENSYFSNLMDQAPTSNDTDAATFLKKFQDFKTARYDLGRDLKSESSSVERDKMKDALNRSQQVEDSANDALTKALGPDSDEFKRLNQGYSQQVYPLRANPIIRKAKSGTLSNNLVDALGTNQTGMPLAREMVKQDPELLKNIVGQRYAVNPKEVFNPNSGMREYLNEMPDLQKLLENHQNAADSVEQAINEQASRKNISLQQKMQAQKELDNFRSLRRKGTWALTTGGLAGAGIGYIPRKIGTLLATQAQQEEPTP